MAKMIVDNAFLTSLIGEVVPLVSSVTGRDLHLVALHSHALPKNRGYEEISLGRLQDINIQEWKEWIPDFTGRLIEYMVEQNILAAYMPGKGEILVIRENVDDSSLGTLLMRLFGAAKIAQYTDGLPQAAAAVKSGRIELLYASFGDSFDFEPG
jgi:hypothetical protein